MLPIERPAPSAPQPRPFEWPRPWPPNTQLPSRTIH
jgi:hypothetical protein